MGGLMSGVEKSIDTNIVDIINHSNSVVINDIHKLNQNYFEGYQWIACLDTKTCLACAELDNKIYDKLPGMRGKGTEPPSEPPLHNNCRCVLVPVLEGMRDELENDPVNYKNWFEKQRDETKLDILGPSRYREYLNGKAVDEFAKDGKITTLKEMGVDRITRMKLFEEQNEQDEFPDFPTNGLTVDEFRKAMIQKMKSIGAEINNDGTINLYHITTSDIEKLIKQEGFFKPSSAPISGGIGTDYGPSSFFGITREYTMQWGDSGRTTIIKVRVPVEYIRQGTGDPKEVYFEGGLKRIDSIWVPAKEPQSTFYDRRIVKNYLKTK
jgi:hypothetical protein